MEDSFMPGDNSTKAQPTTWQSELAEIEKNVGGYTGYLFCDQNGAAVIEEKSFPQKQNPAKIILSALKIPDASISPNSRTNGELEIPASENFFLPLSDFSTNEKIEKPIPVSKTAIQNQLDSIKIFLNENIITADDYLSVVGQLEEQTEKKAPNGIHWQNLAVGICHAQLIYPLAEQQIVSLKGKDANNKDIEDNYTCAKVRTTNITDQEIPILLLSSPALNFAYGLAIHLTSEQQKDFIYGMYMNLFNAAANCHQDYIVLPPAGLGAFQGPPELYFSQLIHAAERFPELKIIYNTAGKNDPFNSLINTRNKERQEQNQGPINNIYITNKNVIFLAIELQKSGKKVALHNPSDMDAVFGARDIGEYVFGKPNKKCTGWLALEEFIAMISTAILGSFGLNKPRFQDKKNIFVFTPPPVQETTQISDKNTRAFDNIIQDETQLVHFIKIAQQGYQSWFNSKKHRLTFFSWRHHHGKPGQKRAADFLTQIKSLPSIKDQDSVDIVKSLLIKHLTTEKGNLNDHSFKTYLLRQEGIRTLLGITGKIDTKKDRQAVIDTIKTRINYTFPYNKLDQIYATIRCIIQDKNLGDGSEGRFDRMIEQRRKWGDLGHPTTFKDALLACGCITKRESATVTKTQEGLRLENGYDFDSEKIRRIIQTAAEPLQEKAESPITPAPDDSNQLGCPQQ